MNRVGPSKTSWGIYGAFMLVLFLVEASYFIPEGSNLRTVAAVAWQVSSGMVLGWAFAYSVLPLFRGGFWQSRDVGWYLAAFFVPMGLVLFGINGYTYTQINDEGLQEIMSALYVKANFKDLGIFKLGFLAYPARQFILAAEPTVVFGRNIVTLRAGFAGLYLISYLAFLTAVWRYLAKRNVVRPMLVASLAATSVSLGSYALLYSRIFEQTMLPLAFTLLLMAGLLVFLERPGPVAALWFTWTLGQLAYSYTPSLAVWSLAVVLLAYMCWFHFRALWPVFASALAYGAVTMAISLRVLQQNQFFDQRLVIGQFATLTTSDWAHRLAGGIHATLGLEESIIPPPLLIGILFVLFHSLRKKDYRVLFVCIWAASCVVASLSFRGYCWRLPEFDVHRAMIILPPLSLALVMYLASNQETLLNPKNERLFAGLVACGVVMMLMSSVYLPFLHRSPRGFSPYVATDTEEATMLIIHRALPGAKTIYVRPPIDVALEETLGYFSPGTEISREPPPDGEHDPHKWVLSFLSNDPATRAQDLFAPHLTARPFLQLNPE